MFYGVLTEVCIWVGMHSTLAGAKRTSSFRWLDLEGQSEPVWRSLGEVQIQSVAQENRLSGIRQELLARRWPTEWQRQPFSAGVTVTTAAPRMWWW